MNETICQQASQFETVLIAVTIVLVTLAIVGVSGTLLWQAFDAWTADLDPKRRAERWRRGRAP